jgi:glycosyl transferase family 11
MCDRSNGRKGGAVNSGHPLIVVNLSGRLGNQLFQFAAARQLELDGASVVFSDRTYEPFGGFAEGPARLESFTGASLRFASPLQEIATGYLPLTKSKSPQVGMVLCSPIVIPTKSRVVRLPSFEPRPETLPTWSRYRIQAYFQHRSWIDRSLNSVLNHIEKATHDSRIQFPMFDLCVSLRRGDYVAFGCDLSSDYYLRSLDVIANRAVKTVVVTSDDRLAAEVMSENLRCKGYDACTANDVVLHEGGDPVDSVLRDFCLIANAHNVVMSNSTFCWWATVLGDAVTGSSDRIVAYPRGWIDFPDDKSDGLLRPGWTIVDA